MKELAMTDQRPEGPLHSIGIATGETTGRALPRLTGDAAPCSHLCYCERAANRAEIKRLRAALKPFADWITLNDAHDSSRYGDACPLACAPERMGIGTPTVGDLRAARRALEQGGTGQ